MKKTSTVTGIESDKSTVKISDTIKAGSKKIKVTAIAAGAFQNNKKLTKLTIGKNISKIGKKAFFKCKKLKEIVFKTALLKSSKVGADAFKGIAKKVTVRCPAKVLEDYKKFLVKKGIPRKAVFK